MEPAPTGIRIPRKYSAGTDPEGAGNRRGLRAGGWARAPSAGTPGRDSGAGADSPETPRREERVPGPALPAPAGSQPAGASGPRPRPHLGSRLLEPPPKLARGRGLRAAPQNALSLQRPALPPPPAPSAFSTARAWTAGAPPRSRAAKELEQSQLTLLPPHPGQWQLGTARC